jgi:hypothetical protein
MLINYTSRHLRIFVQRCSQRVVRHCIGKAGQGMDLIIIPHGRSRTRVHSLPSKFIACDDKTLTVDEFMS